MNNYWHIYWHYIYLPPCSFKMADAAFFWTFFGPEDVVVGAGATGTPLGPSWRRGAGNCHGKWAGSSWVTRNLGSNSSGFYFSEFFSGSKWSKLGLANPHMGDCETSLRTWCFNCDFLVQTSQRTTTTTTTTSGDDEPNVDGTHHRVRDNIYIY